ncbi:type 3 dihydrofolate reductase [Colwellia sp. 4_MG-2023]|jgi:dihydrofolate reductase|uniref:type 3 dihydrofolate reductase n=1 Tax=unclassified Colwellia TaxID=196834 RepID=UPI002090D8DC|nr:MULTISPECIES: type 3 dihydrofolate reductase [unclassified Colwellia]MDO6506130.1 type 3 dihydrofolate reductase [Colwellia sp. 5_MG-2023]MDO6554810.1 type 3 dihydrofolate reductase [Colwellia sp. 4_MG-2023]MDO6651987.1 type 3 dihydrofolate reductase [Colwellia sp. 3_MG-2023]MDO6664763.1 type 3 dihydrofolate reductase [Colwellia sp. 2_MG-2023]MDO6689195.1 type 3 dihydrofolate reductase [Colwellia sp. 1_MG-2023]
MTILSMIVATANNNIIGKDNDMPWHLPADLAYFKKVTVGKPIIMGRKTYESIGRALPGRRNIVISRDANYLPQGKGSEGVDVVTSVEQALALVNGGDEAIAEVMVIGGGAIYKHCLPNADRLYVTHIKADIDGDTQFPNYDGDGWKKVSSELRKSDEKNNYDLEFCIYER